MTHTVHIRKLTDNTGLSFALEARSVSRLLERSGFTVEPLPEHQCGFKATHRRASAVTVFLLAHGSRLKGWQVL